MSDAKIVRGLLRGLSVLRALNENNYATAMQIARATDLPRPTVYRLLHTLMQAGYVTHAEARDTFRLTNMVRSLSDGFDDEAWVTQVAGPVLAELGDKIVWPADIATFDRDSMVVRETTHRRSPLSINREVPGFRPQVLLSSLGLAYLAWSTPLSPATANGCARASPRSGAGAMASARGAFRKRPAPSACRSCGAANRWPRSTSTTSFPP